MKYFPIFVLRNVGSELERSLAMVTKRKDNKANEQKKRRAKIGKLKLNKETIKELTADQQRQLKGGVKRTTESRGVTCTCADQGC